jgi:hypothetical protein
VGAHLLDSGFRWRPREWFQRRDPCGHGSHVPRLRAAVEDWHLLLTVNQERM